MIEVRKFLDGEKNQDGWLWEVVHDGELYYASGWDEREALAKASRHFPITVGVIVNEESCIKCREERDDEPVE